MERPLSLLPAMLYNPTRGIAMASSFLAAGMVLAGLPMDGSEDIISSYARSGIRAFLLPGALLASPERLAALTSLARRLVEAEGSGPCLIALGGWSRPAAVYPAPPGLPSPLSLAASGDRRATRRSGFLLASRAASAGVDLVFGPSLDLATDPKRQSGALDGFGEDPAQVGLLGSLFAAGLARGGVAACALSFPGCGSLVSDGRSGPKVLPHSKERLDSAEIPPFARVIKCGVEAVLVAQVLVPALESDRVPAARSALIVEGRLRSSLGFRGLVIGGAIEEGVEARAELGRALSKAALQGALAGCDLVTALSPEAAFAAAAALERAASEGELPLPRIAISRRRVSSLLGKLPSGPRSGKLGLVAPSSLEASHYAQEAERAATLLQGSFRLDPTGLLCLLVLPGPGVPNTPL